ncbi:carbon-nitrogen hydrolase family protein [Chelativorans intermedius]|uniref:Carbon-nitrogen hydrolase family protein n=1 Tax=Chelativorans intermedius TaxID=515947 RepID=A0ABV6D2B4_9HYPH|nr:carbon-nitrogen hydrolase family protein [Chelativorans intermedius]MCT8997406.1 carbon-nitrogen hydrolase family protein [Chelativorans intermedius]
MSTKIAVIQKPPVLLDRGKTIEAVLASVEEAVRAGASLLIFPEAYIPGYPTWIWRLRPGGDMALSSEIHARLRQNAVDLGGNDLEPIQEAAARHGATIVIGLHEIDSQFSGTTLFNTVVVIGPEGTLLNRHRKLMPTNPERMVWGMGDATGLKVVETPAGRLGCLICWESYMPLARYALYAQGMEIFVNPTWDNGETCLATLRHIAKEGGTWVIGTATALQGSDIPGDFPERDRLFKAEEWLNDGDAVVVTPTGSIAAGPLHREKGILYAELDVELARRARRSLDVCGHYARPDIFSLSVNRKPLEPVSFSG